jgi:hypothetical protein
MKSKLSVVLGAASALKISALGVALVLSLGLAAPADANTIDYTIMATGVSGTYGFNSFSGATVTLTAVGDTAAAPSSGHIQDYNGLTITETVTGGTLLSNISTTVSGFVFVNQLGLVPFPAEAGFATSAGTILGTRNQSFDAYNLNSAISLSGGADYNSNQTLFTLAITFANESTFTATVIPNPTPLPAALPLFATGLGGLGLLGWRRKRKTQAIA